MILLSGQKYKDVFKIEIGYSIIMKRNHFIKNEFRNFLNIG